MTGGLLEGRVALVTGAGGRLGAESVRVLSREGARVAALDVTDPLAERGAAAASGRTCALTADVSDEAAVHRAVRMAEDELGPLDVLVNAHGIYPNQAVVDVDLDEWERVFAVNTRGTMLTCRAVARNWIERGTKGSIVNLSSGAANSVRPGGAHYSGSKAAVNSLTFALAMELGRYGIRVNVIEPGMVLDEVFSADSGGGGYQHESARAYVDSVVKSIPLGRSGKPSDIAEAVAFLASDRSEWTTGAVLGINGGSNAGRTHMPFSPGIR